jgi:hypothetical protein
MLLLAADSATPDATIADSATLMLTIADSATHAEIDTDVAEPEQDINNTTSPNTITPPENI